MIAHDIILATNVPHVCGKIRRESIAWFSFLGKLPQRVRGNSLLKSLVFVTKVGGGSARGITSRHGPCTCLIKNWKSHENKQTTYLHTGFRRDRFERHFTRRR